MASRAFGMKPMLVFRLDRYLRGGDHFPFLDEGYPAVRMTEPVEDFRHQHQDVRMVDGVQYGDLPEFVDFGYVANVARVDAAALASLALGPSAPREVEMENIRLEADTTAISSAITCSAGEAAPPPRSNSNRYFATVQPSSIWPRTLDFGTRTSSKNTWFWIFSPDVITSGRI